MTQITSLKFTVKCGHRTDNEQYTHSVLSLFLFPTFLNFSQSVSAVYAEHISRWSHELLLVVTQMSLLRFRTQENFYCSSQDDMI